MRSLPSLSGGFFIILIILSQSAFGQDESDVLRLSRNFYPSNARSAGIANAFGALGANSIAPSINPAGLGLYRESEFSISPSLSLINTESNYRGNSQNTVKPNFNIGDLSLVINETKTKLGKPKKTGWITNTFAIGINRQIGFHERSNVVATNKESSILQEFRNRAEGTFPSEFTQNSIEGLAFKNWLINPFSPTPDNNRDSSEYYISTNEVNNPPKVEQEQNFSSSGAITDLYLSYGTNYSNKLYLGGSIGIPIVNYQQERTFNEKNEEFDNANLSDSLPNFKNMSFTEEFSTSGAGFYGSFGFIYRPFDNLRIGGSVFTPTIYSLDDEYSYTMASNVKDLGTDPETYNDQLSSDEFSFDYEVITPARLLGSIAFIFPEMGLLSFDYEFKNLKNAQINADGVSFSKTNNTIQTIYQNTHKLRFGAEFKLDIFKIRGGYGYFSSPYVSRFVPDDFDGSGELYSLGMGFNQGQLTYDIAYQLRKSTQFSSPYQVDGEDPEIKQTINKNQLMFTLNYKW